ncbi:MULTISPECIES: sulfate ABC transporter substrate-binding protein [Acinetobacter]|uniref:Sulfate ABC transporter, sulfate-binding protein n=1 Tax=Acinetobacter haemolyticus ATCC 19194 TaxID=707232 RepID=D4XUA0_ACIHA|nr:MULTISPECIES: sulfate ABC transporter substrate-binding protein [Acinetobacter]EEH67899.1 sulfate ABC transporter, sulfate-binding protein [Acinetobacter sp. ATCC 27244]EFF81247.1 sulfate ABC transporter, sulfate-binding protein [Acinetobacter haemolyticus ATCC 19194]NAR57331.1 sulfate ABC transporter substrate-binding protein [Acinetobacter haemolyticus]NAR59884.1 sulfate ABC transporter substrate-binding protein [Acinetobacter haemolyticus]NAR65655.1 sulfate ABC transporter substrate-bind
MKKIIAVAFVAFGINSLVHAATTFLNVSYDPTREFYQEYNQAFGQYWKNRTGQDIDFKQSHGGSGKQARAVIDGLQADVVTLALANDIDEIANAGLIRKDWQKQFRDNSAPYTSTVVFLVRKGNPKNIRDWNDLTKDGVEIITPNPKTGGAPRWIYLSAWGYALKQPAGNDAKARELVKKIYHNVKVLDSGARGSLTTFAERGIGDVLLSWENEALLATQGLGKDKFEIIYPSISILAEPSVAIIDKTVDKNGNRQLARGYLNFLYSPQGQQLAAKHYFRPRNPQVAAKYAAQFPKVKLFSIHDVFGGWEKAQKTHFVNGAIFDQIYSQK